MASLLNYFDLYYGCPRFDFICQDDYILKYCKSATPTFQILNNSPIIVFVGKDFNVYWEYRDGVMDASPVESCVILYKILEEFGSKPFVYVKSTFSYSKCKNIVNLANENNGVVISCPKWSYMDFYRKFYTQREELRKRNTFENKNIDILFLGKLKIGNPTPRIVADYTDSKYKYPVYKSQVDDLKYPPGPEISRQQTEVPGYPQRPWFLEKLREKIPVEHIEGKLPEELPDIYLKSKIHFQPHGVGPRHSIYECMMLGIPSIIPECSYLDDAVRKYNFICSELMHWVPVEDIQNLLDSESDYKILKDNIIDLYERNMTHTSIIDRVFKNIENIT